VNPRLEALLDEVHRAAREHDAAQPDRRRRLRSLEPATGRLLAVLVRALGARRILELGTSIGYSTLWLADAAGAVGGRVTTVEIDAARTARARQTLERAGLARLVELQTADAADVLRDAPDDAWDLVFLDAERPDYPGYWPDLVRTLRPGGLLAVDNAISHAGELAPFRELVERDERVLGALDATGAGVLLVVKRPA
jgi:predicted O-methyltransferase YrrM